MARPAGDPEYVVVGHVSKAHGTKGEVFVWPLTDRPDSTFIPGVELQIADEGGNAPDPEYPAARVVAVRPYRRGFLVVFDGVDDRDLADAIRDRYLLRPFEETDPLATGEIFYHQLLGMRVVTKEGVDVGEVNEVYELRPADMLQVRGDSKEHLIPFSKDVIVSWSLEDRRIVIDPPEGLLDL
jgi:16S rRNA processing protein RimM